MVPELWFSNQTVWFRSEKRSGSQSQRWGSAWWPRYPVREPTKERSGSVSTKALFDYQTVSFHNHSSGMARKVAFGASGNHPIWFMKDSLLSKRSISLKTTVITPHLRILPYRFVSYGYTPWNSHVPGGGWRVSCDTLAGGSTLVSRNRSPPLPAILSSKWESKHQLRRSDSLFVAVHVELKLGLRVEMALAKSHWS